jgi:hypothetical protein
MANLYAINKLHFSEIKLYFNKTMWKESSSYLFLTTETILQQSEMMGVEILVLVLLEVE